MKLHASKAHDRPLHRVSSATVVGPGVDSVRRDSGHGAWRHWQRVRDAEVRPGGLGGGQRGRWATCSSNAPMSQCGPCGRVMPRSSTPPAPFGGEAGGSGRAQTESSPASMAGEPASRARVWVGPPLLASGPRSGLTFCRSLATKPLPPLVLPIRLWPLLTTAPLMSGPGRRGIARDNRVRQLSTCHSRCRCRRRSCSRVLPERVLFVTVTVPPLCCRCRRRCVRAVAGEGAVRHRQRAIVVDAAAVRRRWRSRCCRRGCCSSPSPCHRWI